MAAVCVTLLVWVLQVVSGTVLDRYADSTCKLERGKAGPISIVRQDGPPFEASTCASTSGLSREDP